MLVLGVSVHAMGVLEIALGTVGAIAAAASGGGLAVFLLRQLLDRPVSVARPPNTADGSDDHD